MSDTEKEQFTITRSEYAALNFIEGLAQVAFHMVVAANPTKNGHYVLEGSEKAFDELTSDLADEIHYKLSPASRLKHLEKLYRRLSPDCDGF